MAFDAQPQPQQQPQQPHEQPFESQSQSQSQSQFQTPMLNFIQPLLDPPVHIASVELDGSTRTQPEWLEKQVAHFVMRNTLNAQKDDAGSINAQQPKNIDSALDGLAQSMEHLQRLNIYKQVTMTVDTAEKVPYEKSNEESLPLDVYISVMDKDRYGIQVGAAASNQGDVSTNIAMRMPNVIGNGGTLSVQGSLELNDTRQITADWTQPVIMNGQMLRSTTAAYRNTVNHYYSSFLTRQTGFTHTIGTYDNRHTLSYEAVFRDMIPIARSSLIDRLRKRREHEAMTASLSSVGASSSSERSSDPQSFDGPSPSVVEESMPSLKSSLRYTFGSSTLDDPYNPLEGRQFTATGEVAGLGGDVNFVKTQADWKVYRPLFSPPGSGSPASIGLTVQGGALFPLAVSPLLTLFRRFSRSSVSSTPPMRVHAASASPSSPPHSHLMDRFFLGGPNNLRGFKPHSVGPRDGTDALGGDVFGAAGVHFVFPTPTRFPYPRVEIFGTIGQTVPLRTASFQGLIDAAHSIVDGARASLGIALTMPFAARLEVFAAKPVMKEDGDLTTRFGIGASLTYL